MKRYVTAGEAAEYLGLSERAVRNMVHRGQIPHIKVGRRVRFDVQELDLWMRRQRVAS